MHTHTLRSTAMKIGVILAVVLLVSAGVAYSFLLGRTRYTQILLDISPSDSRSLAPIFACAKSALDNALKGNGSTIDIALVSGSPAAMSWKTVDGRESLWTRLSIGKASSERKTNSAEAVADVEALTSSKLPPNSSDELAALAAAQARANAVASNVGPSRRRTVLCGDGHWAGAGGSAYTGKLDNAGIKKIINDLRNEDLLPDWNGASFAMSFNTVDRADLTASREALIHRLWRAWAAASHTKF